MTDPRQSIPDTILDAPDGSKWLARSRQLIVGAGRDEPIRITVSAQLLPVASVTDGRATVLPVDGASMERTYGVEDVPPDLAAALAAWLATEAATNGSTLLARIYPQIAQP